MMDCATETELPALPPAGRMPARPTRPEAEAAASLARFGHGRDELQVFQVAGQAKVRKIFRHDLERARRNVAKQRAFPRLSASDGPSVQAAVVESFTEEPGQAVLVMPYVEGWVGADIALYAGQAVARQLRSALSDVLFREMADSEPVLRPLGLFQHKLAEVRAGTRLPALCALLDQAAQRLQVLPAELALPLGRCHGDLTLSNVIVSPGAQVVLIDFLDTYLESPLQDVAKLLQEFDHGWSFRSCPAAQQVRGEIFRRESFPAAVRQFERLYPEASFATQLLCLARIAPYVTDPATERWLCASLSRLLDRPGPMPTH